MVAWLVDMGLTIDAGLLQDGWPIEYVDHGTFGGEEQHLHGDGHDEGGRDPTSVGAEFQAKIGIEVGGPKLVVN